MMNDMVTVRLMGSEWIQIVDALHIEYARLLSLASKANNDEDREEHESRADQCHRWIIAIGKAVS